MGAVLQDQGKVAGHSIDTVRALLHDLRQPLAAILLLAGTEGGDAGWKMDGIAGQARWLADLVDTVLSEAAADEIEATDVTLLAEAAVQRARATAACEITVQAEPAPDVWARPVALSRALACVVDNAVRAAGEGGHVRVCVRSDADGVHLTVVDDGPGLGQVSPRTSLGLTTTRAMVAACNGAFVIHTAREGGVVADICLAPAALRSVAS
ncbi:sensor histidine kinase [Pedococcus sp. 5OH_020]|uniref:sensor histidine kinase n=1 Tax=Pedococcus sp. 5OH_020 TaxID=2989814 RepID=UPI0022E9F09C|nr:HAMP domain-containing sensor histidine kinase [Pedococcus sp. 5OH_020]